MVAQLDDRCVIKEPTFVDDKLPVLDRVDIAFDQEKIWTGFDWQETSTRDVDAMPIFEVFYGCTGGCLKLYKNISLLEICVNRHNANLYYSMTIVSRLRVYYDIKVHSIPLHDAFHSL